MRQVIEGHDTPSARHHPASHPHPRRIGGHDRERPTAHTLPPHASVYDLLHQRVLRAEPHLPAGHDRYAGWHSGANLRSVRQSYRPPECHHPHTLHHGTQRQPFARERPRDVPCILVPRSEPRHTRDPSCDRSPPQRRPRRHPCDHLLPHSKPHPRQRHRPCRSSRDMRRARLQDQQWLTNQLPHRHARATLPRTLPQLHHTSCHIHDALQRSRQSHKLIADDGLSLSHRLITSHALCLPYEAKQSRLPLQSLRNEGLLIAIRVSCMWTHAYIVNTSGSVIPPLIPLGELGRSALARSISVICLFCLWEGVSCCANQS